MSKKYKKEQKLKRSSRKCAMKAASYAAAAERKARGITTAKKNNNQYKGDSHPCGNIGCRKCNPKPKKKKDVRMFLSPKGRYALRVGQMNELSARLWRGKGV